MNPADLPPTLAAALIAYAAAVKDAADLIHRVADGYDAAGDRAIATGLHLTEGNVRALTPKGLSEALAGMIVPLDFHACKSIDNLLEAQGADGWYYNIWVLRDGQFSYDGDPVPFTPNLKGILSPPSKPSRPQRKPTTPAASLRPLGWRWGSDRPRHHHPARINAHPAAPRRTAGMIHQPATNPRPQASQPQS